jgi:alpha-beta hydrolase superfamily lysophospholipase
MEDSTMEAVAGVKIFMRSWHPEGRARGVVAIVHGFKSHSGQYQWVAEQLVAHGFAVYALDLRGRGRSEGERFFVDRVEDYVEDVAALVTLARAKEPGLPLYLLGHSAGGVVGCIYALEHQSEIDGLICESFAFEIPAPAFALSFLRGLSRIAPHAHVLRLRNRDFSRDPAVVESMNQDPLIAHEVEPAQTVAALARADELLARDFERITLPLLILHGTRDRATRPHGSQRFYENAGSLDKTLKLYEGGFHDLLHDVDRNDVLDDIVGWIEARLPGAAEAASPE